MTALQDGRLGRPGPGIVVHQRAAAPAGARPAGGRSRAAAPDVWSHLNLAAQPGETTRASPRSSTSRCSPPMPQSSTSTSSSPTAVGARPGRAALGGRHVRRRAGAGRRRCRGRHAPARPGAAGSSVRRPDEPWQDLPMAMTAAVKDELSAADDHEAVLPQGRGVRRCCASPAACTSSAAGSSSRPSSTPVPLPGGCAARSPRSSARPARSRCSRRGAAQGQPLRGPRGQGRRGAGPADRPARRARPSGPRAAAPGRVRLDLRRRGGLARRVPRARLADRARAARPRWRSPAPGPRRRWRWSAPRAGSASPPRPARCAASTASSSATATRSARC